MPVYTLRPEDRAPHEGNTEKPKKKKGDTAETKKQRRSGNGEKTRGLLIGT